MPTLPEVHLRGTRAVQPTPASVSVGALYFVTDEGKTERSSGTAWEPYGPNAVVLYVFVLDPVVPGADYGLGRILADAFPEQIPEIWKLYQGSVTSGGTLLNLNPVEPMPPPMPPAPVTPQAAPAPSTRT